MSSKNYINYSNQLPGKWVKYIKSKNIPDEYCMILEIREIDGDKYICLIKREFRNIPNRSIEHYTDTLIQTEPYTSDEDLKKFEMYNE